jgi:hypothetical protein
MSAERGHERRLTPGKVIKAVAGVAIAGAVTWGGYEVLFGQQKTTTRLECTQSAEVNLHKTPSIKDVVRLMETRDPKLEDVDQKYLTSEATRLNPQLVDPSIQTDTPKGDVALPLNCAMRTTKSFKLPAYPTPPN